ncbi:MAG TPA: MATE family efflux transporter [Candidatus Limnocylindria bacterium]|nr:MATE family efflux transporter [Candidatus Limnocylindria bacterium]
MTQSSNPRGRLRALFSPRDMTKGAPWRRILEFAFPMFVGNIAQQLYASADSAIVGRYVGDNALASVGSTMAATNFLIALFIGISSGAGIVVSQAFGAKNREKLSLAVGNVITLTAISSLIITVMAMLLSRPLLTLLNTPAVILEDAVLYLQIVFLGVIGISYYNILSGVLRGLGDSFSALGFLLLSTALNIALDLWFVVSFGWGVAGAAVATVISQAISAALCYLKLRRMGETFHLSRRTFRLDREITGEIVRLGMPAGITQAIFSMAMLVVQPLQNSFGEAFVATAIIAMRVDGFAMMPNFSFGMAMTTFTGQNIGAQRLDRAQKGALQGTLLAVGVAVMMTSLVLVFGHQIMALFTKTEHIIQTGMGLIRILSVGFIAMAVMQSLSGVMRGAGDATTPMWISIFVSVILRVPLSYLFVHLSKSPENPLGRPESLYFAMLATWLTGGAVNVLAYRFGSWRTKARERMRMYAGAAEKAADAPART